MLTQTAVQPLYDFLSLVMLDLGFEITCVVTSKPTGFGQQLHAEFSGPEVKRLTENGGAVLLALEHLAAMRLRLQPGQFDALCFDAGDFKLSRKRRIDQEARLAKAKVRSTGVPHHCIPMSYRERYMLHRALAGSGLMSYMEGRGAMRHLVLYSPGLVPRPHLQPQSMATLPTA